MKKKIKIDFTDFWGGFDKTNNYFYNLLKEEFDVEITNRPDYLFFSVFGNQHQYYNCKKIFYTGENVAPPLGYCQWSFSFDYLDDNRNYRLPHYLLYDGYYDLVRPKVIDESMAKRKFCNFVHNNPHCPIRNNFFLKLSKYKKVDSGGSVMNNMGYMVTNTIPKVQWIKDYKFSFAFENEAYRPKYQGYTTEKIMQAMVANTIPLYWGNPLVGNEFNIKSFICYDNFNSENDMIDYIIYLDKNDDKYIELLSQPWFVDNQIPDSNKLENIKSFLYSIFNN